ncbi:hypothetical protein LX16_2152 [Stackebrandtia albiflava]|uniref:Uncharacterized protein n=1 Tax=Stackebrandtia albiflava TaxID=406432 RepID=A0A562V0U9_9ACTN|nr:hypothetical protein [Stackebrandtia albiflava]TWJ11433.1 hypothetical protein LX16_2152 [Stackebrandtia albiflava]
MNRWWRLILVLSALVFLVPGVWAFGWPRSFYEYVARFEPFNLHLFHDAGAFQIGIGAALLAAVVWRDALLVGLFGGAVGAVVHGVSHIVDRNLGGNPADPWVLSALAVLLTVATAVRFAAVYRTEPDDGGDVASTRT